METTSATEDRESFEQLVRAHQSAVCAIAYAVVRNRARSEELAQEAFLIAWRHRARVEVVTAGWVCGIARNLARNAARRRTEIAMEHEPMAPEQRDARDVLIEREVEARAEQALAELPDHYREAVVLYYRGDQSMRAVSHALGISEATARQRVHRGRSKLREALAPVVEALGATRPGAAFTGACVAAWVAGKPTTADADAAVRAADRAMVPATGIATIVAAIAGVAAVFVIGAIAMAGGDERDERDERRAKLVAEHVAADAAAVRSATVRGLRARFPPSRARAVPASLTALGGDAIAPEETVDLDFQDTPAHDMFVVLAHVLDAPIWVDPRIDKDVTIRGKAIPVMNAIDDVLAQVGAVRTEVPAIRIVTLGGRSDASQLGGDPMTVKLTDEPLSKVLRLIEAKLHMPIAQLVVPSPAACAHTADIGADCAAARQAAASRVSLDVDGAPAGAVLEQALAQTGYRYELTTGFVVTPGD